jgi:hypothetical protein
MVNPKKGANAPAKRVTIMLDSDLDGNLRKIQAKRIAENIGTVSFSKVINDTLREVI